MTKTRYLKREEITQSEIDTILKYRARLFYLIRLEQMKRFNDKMLIGKYRAEIDRTSKWLHIHRSKYNFDTMKVGDSIFVSLNNDTPASIQAKLLMAAKNFNKVTGNDFIFMSRRRNEGIVLKRVQ